MARPTKVFRACLLTAEPVVLQPVRRLMLLALLCVSVFCAPVLAANVQIETGAHAAPIRRLDIDVARQLLVTAAEDKSARVWSLRTGKLLKILRPPVASERVGLLYGAAIHPSKSIVALGGTTSNGSTGHKILMFDYVSGAFVRSFDALAGDIKNLAWSHDGSLLFAIYAGEHALRAFQPDGKLAYETRLNGPGYGLKAANNGLIAAASLDKTIRILSAKNGRVDEQIRFQTRGAGPVSLSFSANGQSLVVGFVKRQTPPEIYSSSNGQFIRRLSLPSLTNGAYERVSWSSDNQSIVVAGRGYIGQSDQVPMFWVDAKSGQVIHHFVAATDSVNEIRPLPDGRVVFGTFNGSWGIASVRGIRRSSKSLIPDLRGADNLLVAGDGRLISWTFRNGHDQASFNFKDRFLSRKNLKQSLLPPRTSSGLFDQSRWRNTRKVRINGHSIALDADEISRSLSYFRNGSDDAVLGTSRHILRIATDGRIVWRHRTAGEVRAVNVSEDNRLIVSAMSNGTIRWWRAIDGKALMSFLPMPDGKWLLWTPTGYYDTSIGADRFAGWIVNRDDEATADYFSLNRFRKQYYRPAVIDEIMRVRDPGLAIKNVQKRVSISAQRRDAVDKSKRVGGRTFNMKTAVTGMAAKTSVTLRSKVKAILTNDAPKAFPPVFDPIEGQVRATTDGRIKIPFRIRTSENKLSIKARLEGRPIEGLVITKTRVGKYFIGIASISAPKKTATLNLIARDRNGASEPYFIRYSGGERPAAQPRLPLGTPSTVDLSTVKLASAAPVTLNSISTVRSKSLVAPTPAISRKKVVTQRRPAASQKTARNLYVLAIGVSDYERKAYALRLAAKDAIDFGNMIKTHTAKGYDRVSVRTLADAQATKFQIEDGLRWLSERPGPNDVGILFIAGHGINSENGTYYYLPHEGDHTRLAQTAVPEATFRKTLGKMRGKALMFVDTCYGGAVLSRTGSSELAGLANDLSSAENGIVVFASSTGRQLSEENDAWRNGAFTNALLAGLGGKADLTSAGHVTVTGLIYFVSEHVKKTTDGRQTPVAISPAGIADFSIIAL